MGEVVIGCTIGQGLTAGSALALSWPVATLGMIVGARLGLAVLLEGGLMPIIDQWLRRSDGASSIHESAGS